MSDQSVRALALTDQASAAAREVISSDADEVMAAASTLWRIADLIRRRVTIECSHLHPGQVMFADLMCGLSTCGACLEAHEQRTGHGEQATCIVCELEPSAKIFALQHGPIIATGVACSPCYSDLTEGTDR